MHQRGFLRANSDCEPADPSDTVTDRLNALLNSSGPGFVLRLCPSQKYVLQAPVNLTAQNQEISTLGYPSGVDRATLVVNGSVVNGVGHTTAVYGNCDSCSGVKLRNIQVDGNRRGASPTVGDANIELGGDNVRDQLVDHVRSFDPRSWSCLHIAEGNLNCQNALIQNNDIGPCGSDKFQEWADGISVACRGSTVTNNSITGATDGGIVLFGAPGTQVYGNTISVGNHTQLGGINLVDYQPYDGDYTGTIVSNNTIHGGFATMTNNEQDGKAENADDAILKIGIAIGPRTWFGARAAKNVSRSGTVTNNQFSGAFSYAIAISSAHDFTIEGNTWSGDTTFIGAGGPNCSVTDYVPEPAPFVVDPHTVKKLKLQTGFVKIKNGDALTCVLPPDGGDDWPVEGVSSSAGGPLSSRPQSSSSSGVMAKKAGAAVGVVLGFLGLVWLVWFVRRRRVNSWRR